MRALVTITCVVALGAMTSPCPAADPLPGRSRTSVALLSGYGFQRDSVRSSGVSAYRFGFGTRTGVTLPFGGYVGGTFITHIGTNITGTRDGASTYSAVAHDTYFGPEAGFDLALWHLLLRPYAGAGLLASFGKTTAAASSISDNAAFFYVAPGGLIAYRLAELIMGLDLRLPIVLGQSSKKWAPAAMLTVGMALGSPAR